MEEMYSNLVHVLLYTTVYITVKRTSELRKGDNCCGIKASDRLILAQDHWILSCENFKNIM